MSKTMKRVSALLLAILMIVSYMPMMQETAYAAKAKKPAKVKGLKATVQEGKQTVSVSWKKAKNAKKYSVTIKDGTTGLTASKSSKKTKTSFKGQWSTKYTITVKGVNGKKKGKAAKTTVTVGQDPEFTQAIQDAADNASAKDALQKQIDQLQETLQSYKDAASAGAVALDDAQALIDAYDALVAEDPTIVNDLGEDFVAAIEELRESVEAANEEEAIKDAKLSAATKLTLDSWNPEVKNAINDMIEANKNQGKYVVFDFDNTCSIFDVEEQLAVYQLQTMSFDETVTPDTLPGILATELDPAYFEDDAVVDNDGNATSSNNYQDWIDDIVTAYTKLYNNYGPFSPEGLDEAKQAEIQTTDDWLEFATKIRAMYDTVFATESAAVAYPWVLYWFTGMTEQEVYNLAYRSHDYYRKVDTDRKKWTAPADYPDAKVKGCAFKWYHGTQVSDNIKELWAALDNNGIDVWVCSASATDPIRAAVDVWGLHDHLTGLMAMTNKLEGGKYINEYDWEGGYAWLAEEKGGWKKDTALQKTQTQGEGKVIAIENVCLPKYNGAGPIAGFMDSTGDYNFCTEFKSLEVVICFNRADRKQTDGGGVIAELAVYENDSVENGGLGYDYETAKKAGDTLYVLQGRNEIGLRGFNPRRTTTIFKVSATDEYTFRQEWDEPGEAYNLDQLAYIKENKMSVEQVVNDFAIKSPKDTNKHGLPFKYGFVTGKKGEGLGPKFGGMDFTGYHSRGASPEFGDDVTELSLASWNPEVKDALNKMIAANKNSGKYVVFDFDNTCSIFDVEEQLAVYQLQTMAFDETVDTAELREILATELDPEYFEDDAVVDNDGNATSSNNYQDWIDDIANAYDKLYKKYGPFSPEGLDETKQAEIQATDDWKEFATKIRAMYDTVFATESAAVAYPWVLYWFTGMTEEEVYQLAYRSHDYYRQVNTDRVKWVAPENYPGAKVKGCAFTWNCGTQVSDNIKELWAALDNNGIDVWVCSASATDPIRAAVDVWGMHDHLKGLMAMTNVLNDDGTYDNEYDWEGGNAWLATDSEENHGWEKDTALQKTQTQGKGKVIAIQNVLYPKYNNKGPIAGFMDSTGDFNFCTEFKTLEVVCCFNRADRKQTDGGGVIAELAAYQADALHMNYDNRGTDTLYVLQGRNELWRRGLNPRRTTNVIKRYLKGEEKEYTFRSEYDTDEAFNEQQLQYMIENEMTTADIINQFAIKKSVGAEGNPFNFKIGFVYGTNNPDGLGPKFHDDTYNPDDLDFSGYHSQD